MYAYILVYCHTVEQGKLRQPPLNRNESDVHAHTHTYTHAYIHTHIHTHTHTYTHTYTRTHTYTHTYTHTHIHTYIYESDIHTHTHTFICTHTHIAYIHICAYKQLTRESEATAAESLRERARMRAALV